MAIEAALPSAIGLRHVLEDGLSILANRRVAPARREFVLNDLVELLTDAVKGSELVDSTSLLVGNTQRSPVVTFSFMDRYLSLQGTSMRPQLKTAAAALAAMRDGTQVPPSQRQIAARFLAEFLEILKRSNVTGLPDSAADDLVI